MTTHAEYWAVTTYAAYALLAGGVTIWVARTLKRNMPYFFPNGTPEEGHLVESITHLIIVGFYLVNFGAISLALKTDERIVDQVEAVELLSFKVGAVLLIQGLVHFTILAKLLAMKRPLRAPEHRPAEPVATVEDLPKF